MMAEPRGESLFERIVRVLAAIVRTLVPIMKTLAVPAAIAVIGALINHSLATTDVRLKYVELAVTTLSAGEDEVDQELRAWAVKVLQEYAPIPFAPETAQGLETGEIVLSPCADCTDECSYYGQRRWLDDFHYQICGNYDCDACLEWSPIYSPRDQVPPEAP